MLRKLCISLVFAFGALVAGVAGAQTAPLANAPVAAVRSADPSAQQIYAAAADGRLGEARQMVDQVLRDHPDNAKAHYVAAEVYARSGALTRARQELHMAQQLSPGLPFARPAAVAALERELGAGRMLPASRGISLGGILLVLGIGALIYALLRRRSAMAGPYPQTYGGNGPGGYGPNAYGPNPYGPTPYGPGYGAPMGSGLMGNLATGLAVGAGVAAGEELVEHALGHRGGVVPDAEAAPMPDPGVNADMGGSDFGITDGSSWDAGSGGDSFGGGDWGGGGDMGGGGDWT